MDLDRPMPAGVLISFEGGEGSGKSTQAERLAQRLSARALQVRMTREPGGSPRAEAIRSVLLDPALPPATPLVEALLFNAARADHIAAVIAPALAAGHWVLTDRYMDSTRAYQTAAADGLPAAIVGALEEIVARDVQPALTLLLDLPPRVGLARATARRDAGHGTDPFEARDLAFHERLRTRFLEIARAEPQRIAVIDATPDPDAVAAAVWQAVGVRWPELAG